jgi:hypothetical protein
LRKQLDLSNRLMALLVTVRPFGVSVTSLTTVDTCPPKVNGDNLATSQDYTHYSYYDSQAGRVVYGDNSHAHDCM